MTLPSGLESVAEQIQEQNSLSQRWKEIPITSAMSDEAKRCAFRLNSFGSLFFFSKFILNHNLLSPNLHGYMCRELECEILRLALEVPRAHYKTTIASISAPMWWGLPFSYQDEELMRMLGYGDAWIRWMYKAHFTSTRTLIASEVISNARKIGAKISGHYESNGLFRYLFPEILPKRSDKWNQDSMTHNRLDGVYHGEGTYDFLGVKGALQSRHYPRQVIDDPVGEKAIKSDQVMEGTIDWIRKLPGAFDSVQDNADALSDQLFVGNRWSNRDVGAWLRKNLPDMRFVTHDAEGGCCGLHPAGQPIFPEQFTMEKLRELKQIYGSYNYSCQMRNNPIDPEAVRFKRSWLKWYSNNPWKEPESPRARIVNWQQLSYEARKELGGDNTEDAAESQGAMPKRLLMAMTHEVTNGEPIEDVKASDLDRFCLIDPNHSGEQGRARNAILVYGIYNRPPAQRRIYLLDCWAKASSHEEWIEKIIGTQQGARGLAVKWKVHYIYGEFKAAGQVGWQFYFNERRKNMTMHDGLFSIRSMKVDRSPNAKHNRIIGMESIYENGFFWVRKTGCETFLEEYEEYPNGTTIDLLDLAGYMPQTWGAGSRSTTQDFMVEEIKKRNRIIAMVGPAGY